MKRRMVLIMPYYGQLPPGFNYWLKSLEGMDFDVLFLTDLSLGAHPDNLKVRRMSLEDVRMLAERKLGVPVNLSQTYKLCDLRPMFGKIFENDIEDYDYWAYGDCDLVYGKALNGVLGKLLADSVYDVISFRRCWASGPFCVIRNSSATKTLYLKARNYAQVLASPQYECFDELGGWWHSQVRSCKMSVEECGRLQDNFSAVLWRQEGLSFFHEDLISEDALRKGERIEMHFGRLSRNGVEIPLFHYVENKHEGCFRAGLKPCAYERIGNYRITRTGFYSLPEKRARQMVVSVVRMLLGWGYDGAFHLRHPCLPSRVPASVRRRMRDVVLWGLHALRGYKYCFCLNHHVGMGNRLITLANQYVWCGKTDLHLRWGLDDWLPEPFENLFRMTDAPNFRVRSVPITEWSRAVCLPYPKGHRETWRFYVPAERRSECEGGVIDCLYEQTPEWAVKAYEPFFRQLRPSERVWARIRACAVTRDDVCVQVRNTNRKGEYANVSSIRQIVTVMRKFDSSQRFFVSAVDEDYYREIEREFPGRVFGLPDKDYASMVDTVAEMWLLGQGKELICMGGSTFPEISWWWGDRLCRVTQLTKEYQCGR